MGNQAFKTTQKCADLTQEEIKLIMSNSSLSEDRIKHLHEHFVTRFPSGSMNKDEFVEMFANMYGQGQPEKFASLAFKAFDKDGSKSICFIEFVLSTAFLLNFDDCSDKKLKNLELTFDVFDIDKNGRVDKAEMKAVYDALCDMRNLPHPKSKALVDDVFRKYDLNRSGYLEKHEFIHAFRDEARLQKIL